MARLQTAAFLQIEAEVGMGRITQFKQQWWRRQMAV